MQKATATYNAPEGDSKVVEMGGVTFFDGKSVDLNSNDNPHLMKKLASNQHFEFELGEDVPDEKPRRGPGRPRKTDKAPTIGEWVKAGYPASKYPPDGYEAVSSPEEIAAAIEAEKPKSAPIEPPAPVA